MAEASFADLVLDASAPRRIDVFTPLGYVPHAKQAEFHALSRTRVNGILFGGAAGGGKAQTLVQEIPTPGGWMRFGDVHPGQSVFGRDGLTYTVIAETPVSLLPGYALTFDDGSTVECNDEHLWLTLDNKELAALTRRYPCWQARRRENRKSRALVAPSKGKYQASVTAKRNSEREYKYLPIPTGTVRTTAEIVATLTDHMGRSNHAVPVCVPLEMPECDLPIDPYVLGSWGGDGTAATGTICSGHDDADETGRLLAEAHGTELIRHDQSNVAMFRLPGLTKMLRLLGVLNNKHIPHEYLWASKSQRLSLLQGLMDSDGCANKNGTVEFTNTNQSLTESVAHLARSLGHKVTTRESRATLYGKDCGPKWTCKFTAKMPIFRLKRKLDLLHIENVRRTTNFRYIVKAERIGSRPMKCITVSAPDGIYLTGENFIPTHNSAALMMDAIDHAANFPGMKIGCIRRTYNELSESFLAELSKRGYARAIGCKWNNSDKKLFFPNGSEINFTYAENEQDASRLLGGEYQAFYLDEGSRMMAIVIQHVEERLRSGSRGLPVIGLRIATNPGGQAHKYLRDRFITPTDYGKHVVTDENDRTVAFIQSKFDDNPYLDKGYEKVLNAIADPQRRAAMRDGDWDAMVGAFFEQWNRQRILVPDMELPREWQRFAGIDYGYRAPFATIWCAVDNDGRLWAYRELYVTQVDPEHQALLILDAERAGHDTEVFRYADPSMWGHVGTPLSIADQYGMASCGIQKADNDRINGWARVHAALNDGPVCEFHRQQLDKDGNPPESCPMLHVLDGHCPVFCETMPNLPRSTTKPDDAETKNTDDHLPDAFRYLCMAVGTNARPVIYNQTPTEEAIQRHNDTLGSAYNPNDRSTPAGLYAGNLGMSMGSSY